MIQEKNYMVLNNNRIIYIKDIECCCGRDYFFTAFFDGLKHHFCFVNGKFAEGFYDDDLAGLIYRKPFVNITELHLGTIIKENSRI